MEISSVNDATLSTLTSSQSAYGVSASTSSTSDSQSSSSSAVKSQSIEDTVEISSEGKSKAETLYASSADSTSDAGESDATGEAGTEAASDTASITSTTDTEAATDETYNLSRYSEYELQQMLQNGNITAAQYNAELDRREASSNE